MGCVVSLEEAIAIVGSARADGKTIVLANGCFDLLHVGHVRYLDGAGKEGDMLVVGVNGDQSVQALKGSGQPFLSSEDRAELVAGLEVVDLVVVFEADTVSWLLEALRPDVHCKGTDYTEATVPEREIMRRLGGRTCIVGDPKAHSTKGVIELVRARFGNTASRDN